MSSNKLEILASRVVLGLMLPDELSVVALDALEEGFDSPALRMLAGLSENETAEAWDLFDRALAELRIVKPAKRDAVVALAREVAKQIKAGTITPYEGAKEIWDLTLLDLDAHFPELDTFVYGASEWEDRPIDRGAFAEGIMAAARKFVCEEEEGGEEGDREEGGHASIAQDEDDHEVR